VDRRSRELAYCLRGVLFSGACKSLRLLPVLAAQLKTIQEVITLSVFAIFSVAYLQEEIRWNYLVAFALMVGAVFFMFKKW
jgi:uncharacterized protein (DUF486 family)